MAMAAAEPWFAYAPGLADYFLVRCFCAGRYFFRSSAQPRNFAPARSSELARGLLVGSGTLPWESKLE